METFKTPLGDFSCFKNDQNFYFHLKKNSFWELDLIMTHLRPYWQQASTILDIGAHIGSHSFLYGYFNKGAKIFAFEPQKEIYDVLKQNLKERPNVVALNTSVGHLDGTTTLSQRTHCGENVEKPIAYGEGPIMNLGGVAIGQGGQPVSMIRIDSLGLTSCDYIKLDVEGAEGLVIQGAANTIRKFRPVICFEYANYLDDKEICKTLNMDSLPDIKKELEALGYKDFRYIEGDNWLALP
jgi:FkbM family methyltransferase